MSSVLAETRLSTSPAAPAPIAAAEQPDGLSVLYLGPMSGTSRHRRDAFVRLGHRVTTIEPRRLLPASGWIDRLEWHLSPSLLGVEVQRRLEARVARQWFDLVFVDGGSLLTARSVRLLKRHCKRIINFNHDDPFGHRDRTRFSAYREAVPEYDLVVVVRPTNVAEASGSGARSVLLHPMMSDEVAHSPRAITPEIRAAWHADVAFIGSWMPERGPFMLELVRRGVPLSIYGPGWQKEPDWSRLKPHHRAEYLDGDDYAYAVQCAKISLGLLSKGNRDLHTTRTMEIPALGGLLCAERTEEHLKFYREGEEAVFWSDAEECARTCARLLCDEAQRTRVAAAGHLRSLRNGYTSENMIRKVIGALA